MPHRGRHPRRVNAEHGFSDIQAVETIRDQINADRGDDNPQRVYLLTPGLKRYSREAKAPMTESSAQIRYFPELFIVVVHR